MRFKRRVAMRLAFSSAGLLAASSGSVRSQTLNRENQRAAGELYSTTPSPEAPGARPNAAIAFNNLLRSQIFRTTPPANRSEFPDYIASLPLLKALEQSLANGQEPDPIYYVLLWNNLALDLLSIDHTRYEPEPTNAQRSRPLPERFDPTYAEQFGPHRCSRAMAIMQVAVAEAVNAIYRTHQSLGGMQANIARHSGLDITQMTPSTASVPLAITWAAHDTLAALFPAKQAHVKALLMQLDHVSFQRNNPGVSRNGVSIGQAAARATLEWRRYNFVTGIFADGSRDGEQRTQTNTNSQALEPAAAEVIMPAAPPDDAASGHRRWRPDPISNLPFALGGDWREVMPFVVQKSDLATTFLPVQPPADNDPAFNIELDSNPDITKRVLKVRALGGDPNAPLDGQDGRWKSETTRSGVGTLESPAGTPDPNDPNLNMNQTFSGIFWGYDGTAFLCAPPRLYNMIALQVALSPPDTPDSPVQEPVPPARITTAPEMARYLALVNLALADAGIAAWTAKYHYGIARPITYYRTGPTKNIPVMNTRNDQWTPLGQVVSNAGRNGRNTSPPFPAYPSGHAVFGAALFGVMRKFWQLPEDADGFKIRIVSDEFNGLNRDPAGNVRPLVPREFKSFTEAEYDNANSRIYLGIHWDFDAKAGIEQGRKIGTRVATDVYTTLNP